MRLCIGWHFYKEGVKHYKDPHFSSAGFLASATGPWADYYHDLAGGDTHRWDELMAQPRSLEITAAADEAADDEDAVDPVYGAWAEQVAQDWRARMHVYLDNFPLSKEQEEAAAAVYERRKKQLDDYLEDIRGELAEYRHELYRLEKLENDQAAEAVPFQQERIARKQNEVAAQAAGWQRDVQSFEAGLATDLHQALELTDAQQEEASKLLGEDRLAGLDRTVTYLTLAVGACLLLGFLTRIASLAGAGFLLSVMATQPPWVAGAAPVYYQAVEMVALLVLAAVGAGRWGGLDYIFYNLFRRCCAAEGSN